MGFKSVYQSLMDVFPQVDVRILRAVALEHSKDPDLAVESVLSEILPVLESKSQVSQHTPQRPEEEPELLKQTDLLHRRPSGSGKNMVASSDASSSRAQSAVSDDLRNDLGSWDHHLVGLTIDNFREDFRSWDNRSAAPSLSNGPKATWVDGVRVDNGSPSRHVSSAGVDSPEDPFTSRGKRVATPPSLKAVGVPLFLKAAGVDKRSRGHQVPAASIDNLRDDFRRWDNLGAPSSSVNPVGGNNGSWFGLNVAAPNVDDLKNDFMNRDHHVASNIDGLRIGGQGHQVGSSSSQNMEKIIPLSSSNRQQAKVDDNEGWGPYICSSRSQNLEIVIPPSSPNPQQEINQLQKIVDSEELILLHKVPDQGENATSDSIQATPVTEDDVTSQVGKCNDGEVFFDSENEIPSPEKFEDADGIVDSEHIPPVVSALEGDASSGSVLPEQEKEERTSHATLYALDVAVAENVGEKVAEVNAEVDASSGSVLAEQEREERISHATLDVLDVAVGENVGEKVGEVNPGVNVAIDLNVSSVEQDVAMGDFSYEISSSSPSNVSIEVLEEIIEAGKDNKRTLFSAVESVMNKMREVELKEKEAEQAEVEAATAGVDMHVQVEELKKMLGHARDANDMHAGEVYGEKAILSTEVKELQARVANLSDERDSALAVLDEMHQVLEERLVAAEELLRAAEQEKFVKEESAREALAYQQFMMEKVVHESKILQEAAEENSKLREFLMDRGHVVDTLQGEISVICQDVRLLKEKIDNRVPLSQSISSSQTSCILASSGSSSRTVLAMNVSPAFGDASFVSKHMSPASSVHASSPRSKDAEASLSSTENDAFEEMMIAKEPVLDDEWDLVDATAISA